MTRKQLTLERIKSTQARLDRAAQALIQDPSDLSAELAVNSYSSLLRDLVSDLEELIRRPRKSKVADAVELAG
jgi:hypothetical protein